jgi:hypothetical protein
VVGVISGEQASPVGAYTSDLPRESRSVSWSLKACAAQVADRRESATGRRGCRTTDSALDGYYLPLSASGQAGTHQAVHGTVRRFARPSGTWFAIGAGAR